jgi:hypothetical protein
MKPWDVVCGDARFELIGLGTDIPNTVIITDPIWPNAPANAFGVEDPWKLFTDVALSFPAVARRAIIQLGCTSDPRFLVGVPRCMPLVRVCWLRYACPSYLGTILNSGDVAYVFGSREGPEGATILPGEVTATQGGRAVDWHPMPRKMTHVHWLVKHFTRKADLVIDPFCGSGTTGVACRRLGRRFLGIERDPEFARRALERISTDDGPLLDRVPA